MISSLVAGLVLALGQEAPKNYRLPVMPIRQFGEWLEKESGRQVIVLPHIQDRLVYVNVKNRTLPELLGFVKEAIGVGVLDKNGVLTLTDEGSSIAVPMLDKELLQKELDKAIEAKADREQLKKILQELKEIESNLNAQRQPAEIDNMMKRGDELNRSDPVGLVGIKLAETLGVEGLANLPQWERVVFSTDPTRMQRSWPGGASAQILRETNQELKDKNELLAELGIRPDVRVVRWPQSRLLYQETEEISLIRVIARRTGYAVSLDTEAFSADGNLVSKGSRVLRGWSVQSARAKEDELALVELTEGIAEEKVSLSSKEIDLFERFYRMQGFSGHGTPNEADWEWLSTVYDQEPLGGKPSELFDLVLDRLGREAVLQMSPEFRLKVGKSDVALREAAYALLWRTSSQYSNDPKAVLLRSSVGDEEMQWVPRQAEAEFARRYADQGKLTLADMSDLYRFFRSRDTASNFLYRILSVTGQVAENSRIDGYGLHGVLLAGFSGLNSSMQDAVFSESGLSGPVSQMPADIQNLYSSVVRCSNLNSAGKIGSYFDENGRVRPAFFPDWPDNVAQLASNQEQTVFLLWPVFNPPSLNIRAETASKILVMPSLKGQSLGVRSYTPEGLAWQIASSESAQQSGFDNTMKFSDMTQASVVTVTIQMTCGKTMINEAHFKYLASPRGEFGPVANLPEDVRKELESEIVKAREMFQRGGGNPPPPVLMEAR